MIDDDDDAGLPPEIRREIRRVLAARREAFIELGRQQGRKEILEMLRFAVLLKQGGALRESELGGEPSEPDDLAALAGLVGESHRLP